MLVIIGPTGVGKSALSNLIGVKFNGEIVNADSSQVYRGMDIGTAKPSQAEINSLPHHLFDIVDPDERFDVHMFNIKAKLVIDQINSRKSIPIVVGGTGQYIWSIVESWDINKSGSDPEVRSRIEREYMAEGLEPLVSELLRKDPKNSVHVDLKNPRRVIRALERVELGFDATSPRSKVIDLSPGTFIAGLSLGREELYKRVDQRINSMIRSGWLREVLMLRNSGYKKTLRSMGSIGYRELHGFLEKEFSWQECVKNIRSRTHRLIRTQENWFKKDDPRIHWFDLSQMNFEEIAANVYNQYKLTTIK
ncbi:MAG: tRNA (adenosine(37)-N6)-dimethylallyltransferase MiaA [SAR202 cluster bacterium]|jgi:tRNA dimethylallyltransferase|nr:tRNA (adenosine(37)-N6)-dimethylallyltransferase MiaA [SAR202 cluster bacterium]